VGRMVRHSLAARGLRHLRFARRMMVGQPLLARASEDMRPGYQPAYVALDGRQVLLGHVLRHLARHEATWTDDTTADVLPASDVADGLMAPGSETTLRLLPPLAAPDDVAVATDTLIVDAQRPNAVSDEPAPMIDTTPATAPTRRAAPRTPESAHLDGQRPRSRIVELPGVIIQPIEPESEEGSEGDSAVAEDALLAVQADASADTDASIHESERLAQQPPLLHDEPPASVAPTPAPRHRGAKRGAQPPRACDALFPRTDADRSPQSWLARLQQPALSTQAASVKPPTTPDDEPPARGSTQGRRTNERGAREGSGGAQSARSATSPTRGKPAPSSMRSSQPPYASDTV